MNEKINFDAYSFGDAVSVMDGGIVHDYFETWHNGEYYEYPFSTYALCKFWHAGLHLKSAVQLKRNILTSSYKGSSLLSKQDFARWVQDYLWFGNGYIEVVKNRLGKAIKLKTSPAKFTRRIDDDSYLFLNHHLHKENHKFKKGAVLHLIEPDINQELYGVPEWFAAVNTALLNEAATNFRLRYYKNGSHAGYILYLTDPANNEDDIENLKTALKQSKGPGNFKNMMIYAPNGKKDGLQVLPISEVTAKDEFYNIKRVSRDDQISATRTPPNLMGVVPENNAGFGSVQDAAKVFNRNEIIVLQSVFSQLNEFVGQKIIEFDPYVIAENTNTNTK